MEQYKSDVVCIQMLGHVLTIVLTMILMLVDGSLQFDGMDESKIKDKWWTFI